jgi:diaminopimelate epimerase
LICRVFVCGSSTGEKYEIDESLFIEFYKMSASGNDFIIIDNRDFSLQIIDLPVFVRRVCQRKVSVGADGLFLVEPSEVADFKWRFFNSDGSVAEMCGNGSRCAARFAYLKQYCRTKNVHRNGSRHCYRRGF